MFTRIVKMKFKKENVTDFVTHFDSVKEEVRNQPGCHQVVLYQDKRDPSTFFTYSLWEEEKDLDRYRNSDFFKEVWIQTKELFDAKPEAWSVDERIRL